MKFFTSIILLTLTLTACGPSSVPQEMSKSTKEQGWTVQPSSK